MQQLTLLRHQSSIAGIGGQTLSLFLTLIVTPVVFYMVEATRVRFGLERPATVATA